MLSDATRKVTRSRSPILTGLSLVAAFTFLWFPLGQHEFLLLHWMKLGTFMAPFLVMVALAMHPNPRLLDPQVVALVMFLAYVAHQFEEHWIDLLGNEFAFQGSVNALITSVLGAQTGDADPPEILTREAIFVINTSLVWLVASLAIWRGAESIFPVLSMIAIAFINGVSHVTSALTAQEYNPGLLTSVTIFIPLGTVYYVALYRGRQATAALIMGSLAWSLGAHVIMVLGLIGANWWRLYPEIVYFAALVVWSVIPSLVFRR